MDPEIVQDSMGVGEIGGILNEFLSYTGDVLKNGVTIPFSSQPVDLDQLDPNIDVFDLIPEPELPSSSPLDQEEDKLKLRETKKPAMVETVKYEFHREEDFKKFCEIAEKPTAAGVKFEFHPAKYELSPKYLEDLSQDSGKSSSTASNYSRQSSPTTSFQDISNNTLKIEILQNGAGAEIIQNPKVEKNKVDSIFQETATGYEKTSPENIWGEVYPNATWGNHTTEFSSSKVENLTNSFGGTDNTGNGLDSGYNSLVNSPNISPNSSFNSSNNSSNSSFNTSNAPQKSPNLKCQQTADNKSEEFPVKILDIPTAQPIQHITNPHKDQKLNFQNPNTSFPSPVIQENSSLEKNSSNSSLSSAEYRNNKFASSSDIRCQQQLPPSADFNNQQKTEFQFHEKNNYAEQMTENSAERQRQYEQYWYQQSWKAQAPNHYYYSNYYSNYANYFSNYVPQWNYGYMGNYQQSYSPNQNQVPYQQLELPTSKYLQQEGSNFPQQWKNNGYVENYQQQGYTNQLTSNVNNKLTTNVNNQPTSTVNNQLIPNVNSQLTKREGNLSSGEDKQKFVYTGKRGRPPKVKPDQVLDPHEIQREAQWVR